MNPRAILIKYIIFPRYSEILEKGIRDIDNFYITCINDHVLYRYRVIQEHGPIDVTAK